jgi:HEAT repeat protein
MAMKDSDSSVRYWATLGIAMQGESAVRGAMTEFHTALADVSHYVRITAAQAIATHGTKEDLQPMLDRLVTDADWSKNDVFVAVAALTSLDELGDKAASVANAIRTLPRKGNLPDERYSPYVPRLLDDLNDRFR